jgi:branched chain amino acid efflux pump
LQVISVTLADRRPQLVALALAVGVDGIAFGVLAHAAGFDPLPTIVFSALAVSGSAQLATLSILSNGGGALSAALTVLLLNARYVPMSLSVAPVLRGGLAWRVLTAQLVFDESWAMAQVQPGRWDRRLLFAAGGVVYLAWVIGTAFGALGAAPVSDPRRFGLDAVFPAFFLALLHPHLRTVRGIIAALFGAGIALALTPLLPPGVPILLAGIACLVGLRR